VIQHSIYEHTDLLLLVIFGLFYSFVLEMFYFFSFSFDFLMTLRGFEPFKSVVLQNDLIASLLLD
jgi:hypothetical protein